MTFKERFAVELRDARTEKGLTQNALSEKLGMAEKSYAKYEQEKALPGLDRFVDIVKELNVEPSTLLFGKKYTNDEELNQLVSFCPEEKKTYLKEIIKNFLNACE